MLSLGIDLGSSSVKVSIFDMESGNVLASASYPETEMPIHVPKAGWAEQHPDDWWACFLKAYAKAIGQSDVDTTRIEAIGISYQMHGLVCLDKTFQVIRPSIIWCDSRAVATGEDMLLQLGAAYASEHLLNHPGNFTAAKLKWVKDYEPENFNRIFKICLPGDYLAYKLTGQLTTTIAGLSEGVFFDFKTRSISNQLLEVNGLSLSIFPDVKNSFDGHGYITSAIAQELKLSPKACVSYKAGDQPNNAYALKVLYPGEVAATAGTSGVVYAVNDQPVIDPAQRFNCFAHVNYQQSHPNLGVLLCINGAGSANAWIKRTTHNHDYAVMNEKAATIPAGSDGLMIFPFGNGAERILHNNDPKAWLEGLNFNWHSEAHLLRAFQEGIAFAFYYGMQALQENGITSNVIKAGKANMFLSPLFAQTLSSLANTHIEMYNTDGSVGAARAALAGMNYCSIEESFVSLKKIDEKVPDTYENEKYRSLFEKWKFKLEEKLSHH